MMSKLDRVLATLNHQPLDRERLVGPLQDPRFHAFHKTFGSTG